MKTLIRKFRKALNNNEDCDGLTTILMLGIIEFGLFIMGFHGVTFIFEKINDLFLPVFIVAVFAVALFWGFLMTVIATVILDCDEDE